MEIEIRNMLNSAVVAGLKFGKQIMIEIHLHFICMRILKIYREIINRRILQLNCVTNYQESRD